MFLIEVLDPETYEPVAEAGGGGDAHEAAHAVSDEDRRRGEAGVLA